MGSWDKLIACANFHCGVSGPSCSSRLESGSRIKLNTESPIRCIRTIKKVSNPARQKIRAANSIGQNKGKRSGAEVKIVIKEHSGTLLQRTYIQALN